MSGSVEEIDIIVGKIKPLLAGRSPELQGAVLADLLATWLAGHHVEGDRAATCELRGKILSLHLKLMRPLIAINAKIMGTTC